VGEKVLLAHSAVAVFSHHIFANTTEQFLLAPADLDLSYSECRDQASETTYTALIRTAIRHGTVFQGTVFLVSHFFIHQTAMLFFRIHNGPQLPLLQKFTLKRASDVSFPSCIWPLIAQC